MQNKTKQKCTCFLSLFGFQIKGLCSTTKYQTSCYCAFCPLYTWDRRTRAWQSDICNSRGTQKSQTFWSQMLCGACFSVSGKALHNGGRSWLLSSPETPSTAWLSLSLLSHSRPFPWMPLCLHWAPLGWSRVRSQPACAVGSSTAILSPCCQLASVNISWSPENEALLSCGLDQCFSSVCISRRPTLLIQGMGGAGVRGAGC